MVRSLRNEHLSVFKCAAFVDRGELLAVGMHSGEVRLRALADGLCVNCCVNTSSLSTNTMHQFACVSPTYTSKTTAEIAFLGAAVRPGERGAGGVRH